MLAKVRGHNALQARSEVDDFRGKTGRCRRRDPRHSNGVKHRLDCLDVIDVDLALSVLHHDDRPRGQSHDVLEARIGYAK